MEFRGTGLEGKVVVITGGARGMGAAYGRGFLTKGAKVVVADLSWDGVEMFCAEVEAAGGLPLVMDVTDNRAIDAAYTAVIECFVTVAVKLILPGHTRTTGSDEQTRLRVAMGATNAAKMLVPEHVVPLVLYLASQDASQITGKLFDVVQWNLEHGLGGRERWEVPA